MQLELWRIDELMMQPYSRAQYLMMQPYSRAQYFPSTCFTRKHSNFRLFSKITYVADRASLIKLVNNPVFCIVFSFSYSDRILTALSVSMKYFLHELSQKLLSHAQSSSANRFSSTLLLCDVKNEAWLKVVV